MATHDYTIAVQGPTPGVTPKGVPICRYCITVTPRPGLTVSGFRLGVALDGSGVIDPNGPDAPVPADPALAGTQLTPSKLGKDPHFPRLPGKQVVSVGCKQDQKTVTVCYYVPATNGVCGRPPKIHLVHLPEKVWVDIPYNMG